MKEMIELDRWPWNHGYRCPEEKMKLYYTADAFAKTIALVQSKEVEVGWDLLIESYLDGYRVYDILVYPQYDQPANVKVDDIKYGLWRASLPIETECDIHGNGHSHVRMASFASITDIKHQHDDVLTRKNYFCLFQIWNKRNEVSSYFYDIQNKVFYDTNHIEMIVEYKDHTTSEDFLKESLANTTEWKPTSLDALEDYDEFKQIL